ncbi:MAG: type IV secretion system protein [Candidatus Acidiferrales bacterium]
MELESPSKPQIIEEQYEPNIANHDSGQNSRGTACDSGDFSGNRELRLVPAASGRTRVQTDDQKSSAPRSQHWQKLKDCRLLIRTGFLLLCATSAYAQAPSSGPTTFNLINELATELQNLLLDQGGVFLHYGRIELAFIAVFGLTSLGVRWQFPALNLHHHQPLHLAEVYEYLVKLAFVSLLFTYYTQPFPGTNISFDHLFSAVAKLLSASLNTTIVGQMQKQLSDAIKGLEHPTFYNIFATIGYYLDLIVLAAIEVGAILINAFGLAITGLCALFGPLFIPLFLTKNFNRWFWRWVDNFFTYSMYRVIAIAITYLYYAIIMAFFNTYVGTDYSLGHMLGLFPYLLLLTWAYLYSLFKIPSIAAMFFQGAGLSASELTGAAIGFVVKGLM